MGDFRVLGPVEVWRGAERVDAGHPRQQAVLAVLLADAGKPVPIPTLIDRVWGEDPPRSARQSLHAHISRVRQVVQQAAETGTAPDQLVLTAGCYLLDVDPARVDVHRFFDLTSRALDPDRDAQQRVELLRQSMSLWRGEPLAGLRGEWAVQTRHAWRQKHVDAAMAWAEAELGTDNPAAVIQVFSDLVVEYPLNESLAALLMRALSAVGRPAEALAHYESVRRYLSAELGTDPSRELRAAHQAILRGEEPAAGRPATTTPKPAQLPGDIASFAGRREHLARLDALLAGQPGMVVISAVSGTAGVGKTALAVRWAHLAAPRFPDGQLYVNLRGFDPDEAVVDSAEVVRGFLDALGVAPDRIPSGTDAQVGLYRTMMAGRRILVLLDNARDAEQVRPLLPASPGSVAVVTSRNQLTGLVAADDAHPLILDVLSDVEARELLANRLGAGRVAAEPAAVGDIIAACAGLPLALSITAARARQSRFPLATLAAELTGAAPLLDALDTGDVTGQVRSVFSWSYAALSEPAQRVFRLLGLHPGPAASAAAVAALADLSPAETRRSLHELTRASLLAEHVPGRYVSHDLLRAYAAELAATHEPESVRADATRRLLDHYLHTGYAADRLLDPDRPQIEVPLRPPAPGARPEHLADRRAAATWQTTEHAVLLRLVRHAATTGHDTHTWQYAWLLSIVLDRRGRWAERTAIWQSALRAAERLGNIVAQARCHLSIARDHTVRGRYAESMTSLQHALDLYRRSGDEMGQAHTHRNFAHLWGQRGRYESAAGHARAALAHYRSAGDRQGEADALNQVGWYHAMAGDHLRALELCEQSLALQVELGSRAGQAYVWDSLGYAHHHLGHHAEAVDCYRNALRLARDLGNRYNQTQALTHLGDTLRAAGAPAEARRAWDEALSILTEIGHTDADAVRARLEDLGNRTLTGLQG